MCDVVSQFQSCTGISVESLVSPAQAFNFYFFNMPMKHSTFVWVYFVSLEIFFSHSASRTV